MKPAWFFIYFFSFKYLFKNFVSVRITQALRISSHRLAFTALTPTYVPDFSLFFCAQAVTRGVRKDVLRNFAKFTGKQLCQSLFFNKVPGLRPATLLKKRRWHMCFPVNFAKFLRTPFLKNASGCCFCLFHSQALIPTRTYMVRILDRDHMLIIRSSVRRFSVKKILLEISRN